MAFLHRQITPILRALQLTLLAPGLLVTAAVGQTSAAAGAGTDLSPDLRALLDEMQPKWSVSLAAHQGFGYNDNVVLSHADAHGSGFARGGIEVFAWHPPRLPDGRTDYSAYVMAEGSYFFTGQAVGTSGEKVSTQSMASAVAEWRYRTGDVFKFALQANGLFFDQILDQSDTGLTRDVVRSKKTVPAIGATLRWAPKSWWWLEAHGGARRETYRDGFNNATGTASSLQLGWKPWGWLEARVVAEETRRRFASREQYTTGGRSVVGTRLAVTEREGEARIDTRWNRAGVWKTTTRISAVNYADNGSGYFNYRQRRARQRLEWESGAWLAHIEGSVRQLDFEVQDISKIEPGLNPPKRVKTEYKAELRLERQFSKRWSLYGEYTWERSRCNDVISSYRLNEGLLGARWSWEK